MTWDRESDDEYDDGYTRESFERADEDRPEDIEPKSTSALDCPACGGYWFNDVDEEGKAYTCYVCCNTGYVTREAYEEYGRQYQLEAIQSAQSDAYQGENA